LHDDVLRILAHAHSTSQVASLAIYLDSLLHEVLEIIQDNDVIFNWKSAVDLVLQIDFLLLFMTLLKDLLAHIYL
jgi:hypothetical protein